MNRNFVGWTISSARRLNPIQTHIITQPMQDITLPRRSFLAFTAGMLAYSQISTAQPARAAAISLGFSLYGMKSLPLADALRACAEIGYSHVEMALNPGYVTEPAVFNREARMATANLLKELKLAVPSLMVHMLLTADDATHAKNLQLIADASELGRDLVSDQPPMLETILGGNPTKWEEQKTAMTARLRDWAAAAEKAKTTLALKAHVNSAVNSPARLLWLLSQVRSPALQVAYDYSHFELQGMELEQSLRELLPRTRFIHMKDSRGEAAKFQFVLPGEGKTDYVNYFSLLKKLEYRGPVCVEVSSQVFNQPGYDPVVAAKRCYETLSAAMRKAE